MSHKVGVMDKKLTRITDIVTIAVFISLTLIFTVSKKFDIAEFVDNEDVAEIIEIEKVEITQQIEKVIKPTSVKIPIAVEDDEEFEEDEEFEIEDSVFDFDSDAPPPPPPPAISDDDEIIDFYAVQEKPELPKNVEKKFKQYIAKNYPKMARRAGVNGSVTLKFICSKEGIPTNIRVLREKPKDMDFANVAIAALKTVRFNPGIQRDRPVNVSMAWPVTFRVKK